MTFLIREARESDATAIWELNCNEMGYQYPLNSTIQKLNWTEIAQKAGIIIDDVAMSVLHDCGSVRRMLIASINTAKENTK